MSYVFVAGHLGEDAKTAFTQSGKKVISFSAATTSRKGDKEETIWWRVSMWGDRWDKLAPYLKKGKAIMVRGELRKPRTYVDKNGITQISALEVDADSVQFPPFGRNEQQGQAAQTPYTATTQQNPMSEVTAGTSMTELSDNFESEDDQLPF